MAKSLNLPITRGTIQSREIDLRPIQDWVFSLSSLRFSFCSLLCPTWNSLSEYFPVISLKPLQMYSVNWDSNIGGSLAGWRLMPRLVYLSSFYFCERLLFFLYPLFPALLNQLINWSWIFSKCEPVIYLPFSSSLRHLKTNIISLLPPSPSSVCHYNW